MNRYFLQMGVRMACFLGAIFLADGWLRWVLLAAAVVLPYSAVLFANAGRDRMTYGTSPVTPQAPAGLLPATPAADASTTRPPGTERDTERDTDRDTGSPADGGRVIEHVDDGAENPDDTHDERR